MSDTIKNIIFDLGGVLLDIDYNKTADAFKALGYHDFDRMYSQFTADKLFAGLETGTISEEDFLQQMATRAAGKVSVENLTAAWNKMLLTWRESSLAFLKTLSPKYKIYLLSNTNAIHLEAFNKILEKQTSLKNIDGLFTKAYYSNQINLRKPGKEIFEFVLRDAGIDAKETMFIDDSQNNIDTANALNFKTHLLLAGERVEGLEYGS